MQDFLNWGIDVIVWMQQFSPALDLPFKSLTFLGNQEFFMLLLPFVYWCVDRRLGARLIILFLLSVYVNTAAKLVVDQPRPFDYDSRVRAIVPAEGGGLPSGHTQNTVVVWGYLATRNRSRLLRSIALVLIIGVPLSRVYLGVHFPTDLAGGYVLGLIVLGWYVRLVDPAEQWFTRLSFGRRLAVLILLPVFLAALTPSADRAGVAACGTFAGMAVGFLMERRWVHFRAGGDWWKRLLRFLAGITVLLLLYGGLKQAFETMQPVSFFRFVRYAAVGMWGALGAPWLFLRLRLAEGGSRPGRAD